MKPRQPAVGFDHTDLHILHLLQDNCRQPLARIGEQVGLSAPSVMERVKKLEDNGVITGYHAALDGRLLGKDITAFIGVSIGHPKTIERFERAVEAFDGVLECHHVTGNHTLLLKVKTDDTAALEALIRRVRSVEGVQRTETMIVLSTHTEHTQLSIAPGEPTPAKRARRGNGERTAREGHVRSVGT